MIRTKAQAAKQEIKQKPFVEREVWSAIWVDFRDVVCFRLGYKVIFQNGEVRIRICGKEENLRKVRFLYGNSKLGR